MGGQYKWINVTPNEIINAINNPIGKKIATAILDAFSSNGFTYKARAQSKSKYSTEPDGYTVYFYIKKSKESIIMNTRYFKLQLRINDWSTFEKLDDYSQNIRKAILIDSVPSLNNFEDGSYIFTYHGKEYRLCYQISNNFIFRNLTDEDIDSLMDIICREIAFK